MPESKYYLDGELKVIEDELGRKQVGISKRAIFNGDALADLGRIEDEFVKRLKKFKLQFREEACTQEEEIDSDIAHVRFFLEESKRYRWGHNTEFDRLRRDYISLFEQLKKEKRRLRLEMLKEDKQADKDIRDAEEKRLPFRDLI